MISFLLKIAFRVAICLLFIPVGVYLLLNKLFPEFSRTADYWYIAVYTVLTIISYIVLYKPIVWIMKKITSLEAGY